jgi:two-component system sensor kinase FixL
MKSKRLRARHSIATPRRRGESRLLGDPSTFFEATFKQAADAIAIVDAQGRLVFLNEAARQIAQLDPEGTSLADAAAVWGAWGDGDGNRLPVDSWPVARALRGEVIRGVELHRPDTDGSRTSIQVAAAPLRDSNEAIIGAIVTFTDITSRLQSETQVRALNLELQAHVRARTRALEEAQQEMDRVARAHREAAASLERSREMLQVILDRSTAVIYVKDAAGRYLLINNHYAQLFGITNEEIRGRTDYDIFPADTAAHVRANDERVLATGSALQFEELVPQDGTLRTYVSAKFPLRDDDGMIYAVCGISTDISERQAMEAELRRSEATLSAVIESSPDAILVVDRRFRLVNCNALVGRFFSSLFGAQLSLDTDLSGPIPADFCRRWFDMINRARAGERFTIEETVSVDSGILRFLVSFAPASSDDRNPLVTIFAKDITELRRAEEQARRHQGELAHVLRVHTMGEMAANLAHEINQPLGAIANYAQGWRRHLEAGKIDRAALLHAVEEIAREALRAGAITRRVRELLRKGEEQRVGAHINDIVSACLDIITPVVRDRRAVVRFHPGSDLPPVEVDPIQIEQVVLNLLLNGLEAMEACAVGELVVRTSAAGEDRLEVVVQDCGSGLDAVLMERIFEPFFTTKANGLGMGLVISRSIIEAHGGRLWATPNQDAGATFRFTLPLAPGEP